MQNLQELKEQNLHEIQRIIDQADLALERTAQFEDFAIKLNEAIEGIGHGASSNLEVLSSQIVDLKGEMEGLQSEAATSLKELTDIAAEATTATGAGLEDVYASVTALDNVLENDLRRLSGAVDLQKTEFEGFKKIIGEIEGEIRSGGEQAEPVISSLEEALDRLKSSSESKQQSLDGDLEQLRSSMDEGFDDIVDKMEDALGSIQDIGKSFSSSLEQASGDSIVKFVQVFLAKLISSYTENSEALKEAFTAFDQLTDGGLSDTFSEIDSLVDDMKEVVEIIKKIEPVLKAIKTMLV